MNDREVDALLDPLYKGTDSSACFTSAEPLLREARRIERGITRDQVRQYLARQRVYTLHRRVVRRFPRLRTRACGLHTHWQADLADMQRLKRWNRGFRYMLVCIDVLSRQLYVEPVRSKRSGDMIDAFGRVFHRCGYMPWHLMTDAGREFTARSVQAFFKQRDVQHHCMKTSPLWHAGMAERANRSIKERLYRYFTHRGTKSWVSVIQRLVQAMNATPHSGILGRRPVDVNFANAEQLRKELELHASSKEKRRPPRFKLGDEVRVEKGRHVFRKGYLPTFTDEVFRVSRVRTTHTPVTYRLEDASGEQLEGWFYANELCLVRDTERHQRRRGRNAEEADAPIYEIEEILQRRKRRDAEGREVEECFVKWKNYSKRYNSWIPATSII